MAADANIFQQYLKAPKSIQEYTDEANASRMHQQAMQKNELELQAMQQQMQRSNALRDLISTMPSDPKERIAALRSSRNPEAFAAADALEKSQFEREKQAAETKQANYHASLFEQQAAASQSDQKYQAAVHHAQSLAYVRTPDDIRAYIAQGIDKGVFPPMDPEQINQKLAQFKSVDDFKAVAQQAAIPVLDKLKIEAENERNRLNNETSRLNNRDTNATSRANNAASNAVTMRGQNMTDARTRESNAANMSKPFEVTGPDGNPMLVQQTKQGEIVPVKGYAPKSADKPLTDSQSKAALFGSRMESAGRVIDDLAKYGTVTSVPGSRAGYGVGAVVNAMSSGNQQRLDQAKRDFVNAVMRRESGAVISDSEFANAEKQYFPQIGDSDAVIKQKAQNRAIATRGIQAEVPRAQRGILKEIQGTGSDIHAQADAILRGK